MISGEVVQSALMLFSGDRRRDAVAAVDATSATGPDAKEAALRSGPVLCLSQGQLRRTPEHSAVSSANTRPLSDYATSWHGLVTSDNARFVIRFWEDPGNCGPLEAVLGNAQGDGSLLWLVRIC